MCYAEIGLSTAVAECSLCAKTRLVYRSKMHPSSITSKFLVGNLIDAIAHYSEAIRHSPGSANFYIERGHVYIVAKSIDAAIADLTEAIRLNPQNYHAFDERGLAHFMKGDLVRAQENFTAAYINSLATAS